MLSNYLLMMPVSVLGATMAIMDFLRVKLIRMIVKLVAKPLNFVGLLHITKMVLQRGPFGLLLKCHVP